MLVNSFTHRQTANCKRQILFTTWAVSFIYRTRRHSQVSLISLSLSLHSKFSLLVLKIFSFDFFPTRLFVSYSNIIGFENEINLPHSFSFDLLGLFWLILIFTLLNNFNGSDKEWCLWLGWNSYSFIFIYLWFFLKGKFCWNNLTHIGDCSLYSLIL